MNDRYGESSFGFEDLEAYKAARAFRNRVYKLAERLPDCERFGLCQQLRRAAVSLTANVAEGYGRFTWQDTTQFIRHARGSLMELVDGINVCGDQSYAQAEHLDDLKENAERVLKLLNGYISYLQRQKKHPGEDKKGN